MNNLNLSADDQIQAELNNSAEIEEPKSHRQAQGPHPKPQIRSVKGMQARKCSRDNLLNNDELNADPVLEQVDVLPPPRMTMRKNPGTMRSNKRLLETIMSEPSVSSSEHASLPKRSQDSRNVSISSFSNSSVISERSINSEEEDDKKEIIQTVNARNGERSPEHSQA